MSGWIKLHRSMTDHWLYKEKRVFSKFEAWNDILLTVNYAECKTVIKGKLYHIERGQSILSFESWGKRWNWDKSKVRRFLNLLQSDNMIELKTDTITTQLTVCNYATYQDERNADETQVKRKRNTNETQTKLIKEEKERKEEKEIYIPEFSEFLAYALELKPNINNQELKLKYEAWKVNGWKDGNDKPIKNWKSKLAQTLKYISTIEPKQTNEQWKPSWL